MAFLTTADFTGKYELHIGYDEAKLEEYIDLYEPKYLRQLFGVAMYNEFMSDIDPTTNEPQSPNFKELFEPFAEDVTLYHQIESDGIKTMLKGFIFFEFARDLMTQQTSYGAVRQATENGQIANTIQSLLYVKYNEAVRSFKAIREFIYFHRNPETGQVVTVELNPLNLGTNYSTAENVVLENATSQIPIGGIASINFDPTFGGTGYTTDLTNVPIFDPTLSGTGGTVDITTDGNQVLTITINQQGTGYLENYLVYVDAGNQDCQFEISTITYETVQVNPEPLGTGTVTANIDASPIGAVDGFFLSNTGTGYTDGEYGVVGGFGTGMTVAVTVDPLDLTGAVFTCEVVEQGTGYEGGDLLTIQGGNVDAEITVTSVTIGEVQSVTLVDRGVGFKIGDQLTIMNGDQNCNVEVTYVGIGDRGNYNGLEILYTHWL